MGTQFRELPSVDRILSAPQIAALVVSYSHQAVADLIRKELEEARIAIAKGLRSPTTIEIIEGISRQAARLWKVGPRLVINATGVIIHTNLGRAPLSESSLEAIASVASSYTDLEFSLPDGVRGSRQKYVEQLLVQLTNAEAALTVNNNASAVLLALTALAKGKEVIISRGEGVEVGGGFRIPDVMRESGVHLIEVGTTNRTYIKDFENAITPQTGALLKVHPSNFRIVGFTKSATIHELVQLGNKYSLPVLHDLGSGCFIDTTEFGLPYEPTPQDSISAGVKLAMFSGDKLLGGPQCGILVGEQSIMDSLSSHALARAVRLDKLNLAALSATLLHYLKDEAITQIPIWNMISETEQSIKRRVKSWADQIPFESSILSGRSTIGGGSLPEETLPTWLLALHTDSIDNSATAMANRLREQDPPVLCRVQNDQLTLDPRTVLPNQDTMLIQILNNLTT
ncbi:L-seryl-tRNA(Sec) selenium transferase [SAR202 cluster bacterium AD-802-E10_MRT_200m]|nr:L-seryl-tRNA(Sec) selenium transferase [SAR202 cluster bacterium AD-802-E10_MRT_200m]